VHNLIQYSSFARKWKLNSRLTNEGDAEKVGAKRYKELIEGSINIYYYVTVYQQWFLAVFQPSGHVILAG